MRDEKTYTFICPHCGADNRVTINLQKWGLVKLLTCWHCAKLYNLDYEGGSLVTRRVFSTIPLSEQ